MCVLFCFVFCFVTLFEVETRSARDVFRSPNTWLYANVSLASFCTIVVIYVPYCCCGSLWNCVRFILFCLFCFLFAHKYTVMQPSCFSRLAGVVGRMIEWRVGEVFVASCYAVMLHRLRTSSAMIHFVCLLYFSVSRSFFFFALIVPSSCLQLLLYL